VSGGLMSYGQDNLDQYRPPPPLTPPPAPPPSMRCQPRRQSAPHTPAINGGDEQMFGAKQQIFGTGQSDEEAGRSNEGIRLFVRAAGRRFHKTMTLQEAKSIARHLGLTLRKVRSGDYRVNFRDGNETTAYYTDDLEDAVSAAV
jgi:hypothetical protein